MKTVVFKPDVPVHICLKGINGNLLFYCQRDRLVFLSILSAISRRMQIKVLSICLMFNHIHLLVRCVSLDGLRMFIGQVQSRYAREFNQTATLVGPLFMPFIWAQKSSGKQVRSTLAYIANNPVEKQLCKSAMEDRWTFLRYYPMNPQYPSGPGIRRLSRRLRRSIELVNVQVARGGYINYGMMNLIYGSLNQTESRFVTDFIISRYCPIDYESAVGYYGSFEKMIQAFENNTGSEYDLDEEFRPDPDTHYLRMIKHLHDKGIDLVRKPFLKNGSEEAKLAYRLLGNDYRIPRYQIARFFHLKDNARGG